MNINRDMNIIDILQYYVDELVKKEHWKENDGCEPEFWVSLSNECENDQSIMITIDHCGCKLTEKLFPRDDGEYGYEPIINQMVNMYNRTM